MKINKRGLKKIVGTAVLSIALLLMVPHKVYGAEDPQEGTADSDIENMIAVGKTLIGKTPYVYGGGHGTWNTQKDMDVPTELDCSSFIAWALYRGMGIDMGSAPVSGDFKNYFEVVGTGSLDKAKRGDFVADAGHIEIYLGKDDSGTPYSLHAGNERDDIKITKTSWGESLSGKTIVRPNLDDAKSGKNGLSYKESAIIKKGVSSTKEEDKTTEEDTSGNKEDLFTWLNPIVDFTGASNTHAKSEVKEKRIDGNNKGLKGNKKGVFDIFF